MKKLFFDTSVIIAGLCEPHPHFLQAISWLKLAFEKKVSAFISTHCVAECFSGLSRLPLATSIMPSTAEQIIQESVLPHFEIVALSATDYKRAIKRVVLRSISGAVVYDSLHLQAALKKKADALVTINQKDFIRLIDPHEMKLINPLETSPSGLTSI